MTTVSLAMIVKDAESTLARALESVRDLCDEMIVVDTGSNDGTVEIAKQFGASVYYFAWIDNFAAARNRSFELCSGDWIMWLDADDVISEESCNQLMKLKLTSLNDDVDGIFIPYQQAYATDGNCMMTTYRERLLRRKAELKWDYPVHECIYVPPDRATHADNIFIEHRPTEASLAIKPALRNLNTLEKALSKGDRRERNLFYYGNELRENGRYEEAIVIYKEYLELGSLPSEVYWAKRSVGRCYFELDQPEEALTWALRAIEADPKRAESFNDAGLIYYKQNRIDEAIPFFFTASTLPKIEHCLFLEDWHYEWLPHDYLSTCYLSTGDYEKALDSSLKALNGCPDQERMHENINFLTRLVRARPKESSTSLPS